MTAVDVLQRASNLISDSDRWCRYSYARDALGNSVDPCSDEARRWCVIGATWKVEDGPTEAGFRARDLLARAAGGRSIAEINDHESHARVLGLIWRAINLA